MQFEKIDTIEAEGLKWNCRQGTSDLKAVAEVVTGKGYQRKDFNIEAGETWIDVGANIGAFCVLAGSRGANVLAFEPDIENCKIARSNIDSNNLTKSVNLNEFGLWEKDKEGEVNFYRNTRKGNLWRNSAYKKWQGGESVRVNFKSIEPYWKEDYCIKIDAEGAEMPILEKYAEHKVKKLVFEWSFDIDSSLERFEAIIEKLEKIYTNVVFQKYDKGYKQWQASWFPACRTIWCYG